MRRRDQERLRKKRFEMVRVLVDGVFFVVGSSRGMLTATFALLSPAALGTFTDDRFFAIGRSFVDVHSRIHGDEDVSHGALSFNRQDTFAERSLDLDGEWCEAEIDLLAQVLKPGDVVL